MPNASFKALDCNVLPQANSKAYKINKLYLEFNPPDPFQIFKQFPQQNIRKKYWCGKYTKQKIRKIKKSEENGNRHLCQNFKQFHHSFLFLLTPPCFQTFFFIYFNCYGLPVVASWSWKFKYFLIALPLCNSFKTVGFITVIHFISNKLPTPLQNRLCSIPAMPLVYGPSYSQVILPFSVYVPIIFIYFIFVCCSILYFILSIVFFF